MLFFCNSFIWHRSASNRATRAFLMSRIVDGRSLHVDFNGVEGFRPPTGSQFVNRPQSIRPDTVNWILREEISIPATRIVINVTRTPKKWTTWNVNEISWHEVFCSNQRRCVSGGWCRGRCVSEVRNFLLWDVLLLAFLVTQYIWVEEIYRCDIGTYFS